MGGGGGIGSVWVVGGGEAFRWLGFAVVKSRACDGGDGG